MRAAPPADSRLGALQRGRGAGARAVLADLEAGLEDVLTCVLDDPRIDRQVEARDDYYAALLVAAQVDPGPIAEHIRKFWDPRMRKAILAHLDAGGSGLDPSVRDALETLKKAA